MYYVSNKLEELELRLEKVLGFRNMYEKLENVYFVQIMIITQNSLQAPCKSVHRQIKNCNFKSMRRRMKISEDRCMK